MIAGVNAGKKDLGLSVREASEVSGLSSGITAAMLKSGGRAEKSGYLISVQRSQPGDVTRQASVFRPVIKKDANANYILAGALHPAANAFYNRSNAWRIHALLSADEEVTVADLETTTGLKARTVLDNLKRLAEQGLAIRVDWVTWTGTLTDADTVAAPDGIDHQVRRRERYAAEQERFRLAMEARLQHNETERRRLQVERGLPPHDETTGELLDGGGGVMQEVAA